jgi:probable F420-dependent oxidoreductase
MAAPETVKATRERLGQVGAWLGTMRKASADGQRSAVRRVEVLGYGSLWAGEVVGANNILVDQAVWLCASNVITTGAGIANIWSRHPADMQAGSATLAAAWPGRTVLGLGVSHSAIIDRTGQKYEKPLTKMREYLDEMDRAADTGPQPQVPAPRVLAALRHKMLELARDRADGAHTYFVPPEHTARARQALGPDRLLIPEQAVVVDANPTAARRIAREQYTKSYLRLPNYVNNLRDLGYTDEDLADGGSDRLVDSIVAWGDPEAVAARIREHHAAGADHVLLQPLASDVDGAISQLEDLAIPLIPA